MIFMVELKPKLTKNIHAVVQFRTFCRLVYFSESIKVQNTVFLPAVLQGLHERTILICLFMWKTICSDVGTLA
jgi:hypothetical protein